MNQSNLNQLLNSEEEKGLLQDQIYSENDTSAQPFSLPQTQTANQNQYKWLITQIQEDHQLKSVHSQIETTHCLSHRIQNQTQNKLQQFIKRKLNEYFQKQEIQIEKFIKEQQILDQKERQQEEQNVNSKETYSQMKIVHKQLKNLFQSHLKSFPNDQFLYIIQENSEVLTVNLFND